MRWNLIISMKLLVINPKSMNSSQKTTKERFRCMWVSILIPILELLVIWIFSSQNLLSLIRFFKSLDLEFDRHNVELTIHLSFIFLHFQVLAPLIQVTKEYHNYLNIKLRKFESACSLFLRGYHWNSCLWVSQLGCFQNF